MRNKHLPAIRKMKQLKTNFMIHILPVNDLKEHEELTTCKCKPRIEILDDGEIMVVHNSYDGREYIEELVSNINNN